jgi:hypothetical protein
MESPQTSEQLTLVHLGQQLSLEEAEQLEEHLRCTPNDVQARLRLVGYWLNRIDYDNARFGSGLEARLVDHLDWFVREMPSLPLVPDVNAITYCLLNREQTRRIYNSWVLILQSDRSVNVLKNVIRFLRSVGFDDRLKSELYLELKALTDGADQQNAI